MKWKESYLSWNGIQSLQEGPEAHNQQISWIKENNQIQFHSSQIAEWNGLIDFINWWFSNTNPSNTSTFLLAFAKRKKSLMNLWGLPRRSSALGHRLFIPFHCAAQPTSLFFIKEKFVDCLLSLHFVISLFVSCLLALLICRVVLLVFVLFFLRSMGGLRPSHNPQKERRQEQPNKPIAASSSLRSINQIKLNYLICFVDWLALFSLPHSSTQLTCFTSLVVLMNCLRSLSIWFVLLIQSKIN